MPFLTKRPTDGDLPLYWQSSCNVSGQDEDPITHGPAAQRVIPFFAGDITLGPPNETGTATFIVTNDRHDLFAVQPAVSADGTLTYTAKPNAQGTATVTVILDDGGDGTHTSPPLIFPIEINKPHKFHNSADTGDRNGKDVTGSTTTTPDGFISAGDVLAVINYINAHGSGPVQAAVAAPPISMSIAMIKLLQMTH